MSKPAESQIRLAQADIHQQWENDYLNPDIDPFYDEAFARIVSALGDTDGKTILDIGCGYCFHTVRLARSGLAITSVDFSEEALSHARVNVDKAGIGERVTLRQADATALPFEDTSFDNVLIWGVLMHIPEVKKALAEAARVLKPGGKLALSENNAASLEVGVVEPAINVLKRLMGRRPHIRERAAMGIEEWQTADRGGLMVRKTDTRALADYCASLGLTLEKRFAGQFTELYARVPGRALKRLVHRLNHFYFRHIGVAGPALGNILIFRKDWA